MDDLFAGYGSIRVLNGVSLKVQPGSITALLGSNGAGKTTLMRTIVGLIQADRGQILHEGKPIHRLPPQQRVEMGIVLVPEGRQVFSDFTVEENLKLGAFVPRARERMSTHSGGDVWILPQARRAAPAGGAHHVRRRAADAGAGAWLDVASAAADAGRAEPWPCARHHRSNSSRSSKQIRDNGVTIFIVEQNVQTTLQIADQAYVLDQGKVVLQGAGATLAKEPRIRAAYLGM